jgi:hypothetical protein
VLLDGLFADPELVRDLFVLESLTDQLEDRRLAIGEPAAGMPAFASFQRIHCLC